MSDAEAEEIFSNLKWHWKESPARLRGKAKNAPNVSITGFLWRYKD